MARKGPGNFCSEYNLISSSLVRPVGETTTGLFLSLSQLVVFPPNRLLFLSLIMLTERTATHTMGIIDLISVMAKVFMLGMTVEFTTESSTRTNVKEKEVTLGPMVRDTKVISSMDNIMERELTGSQTGHCTMESGSMVFIMDRGVVRGATVAFIQENGVWEKLMDRV